MVHRCHVVADPARPGEGRLLARHPGAWYNDPELPLFVPPPEPRYRFIRHLGRGGMGVVDLVYDAVRDEQVARKRIVGASPERLIRFKREFRSVEGVIHPGLVRLHELGEDATGLYFTMTFIDGWDLRGWCRGPAPETAYSTTAGDAAAAADAAGLAATAPAPPVEGGAATEPSFVASMPDEARLAAVLPRLLDTLAFLHARGIVHRDLKPSNILVARSGELKLVDFGILGHVSQALGSDGAMGTLGYMAPEQLQGGEVSPATDLYGLGATLFTLYTGRRIYEGTPGAIVWQARHREAPRLRTLQPAASLALDALVARLLSRDPAARPCLATLGRELLPALDHPPVDVDAGATPEPLLVGRAALQSALRAALSEVAGGSFAAVALTGPSGVGKSALARWTSAEARARGWAVLAGRGRPSERLPFVALDGVVDDLALTLGAGCSGEVGSARRQAASVFPVLAVEAPVPRGACSRPEAFRAVISLIAGLGAKGGVVVLVDDLQWADEDALDLIRTLVGAAPRGVLLLMTARTRASDLDVHRFLAEVGARRLEIGALDARALGAIVAAWAQRRGVRLATREVSAMVTRCAGRPLLAELVGRGAGRAGAVVDAEDPLGALADEVFGDDALRRLIGALLAADEAVSLDTLPAATALPSGAARSAAHELELRGLVRWDSSSHRHVRVELVHDEVRAALAPRLPPTETVEAHERWLLVLDAEGESNTARRVHHLLGAGRRAEARRAAMPAAHHAERLLAWGLAARMVAVAMEDPGVDRIALMARRADLLTRAGRYLEAAACWSEVAAARGASAAARDARLHEAHARLLGDDVATARALLRDAYGARAWPDRPGLRCSDLPVIARLVLAPRRRPSPPPAALRAPAADAELRDVRLATFLALYDPLAGMRLLLRARRRHARRGEHELAASAELSLAYFAFQADGLRPPLRLWERWEAAARARLGEGPIATPMPRLTLGFLEGMRLSRDNRIAAAAEAFEACIGDGVRAGMWGTVEHLMGMGALASTLLTGNRYREGAEWVARCVEVARGRRDNAALAMVALLELLLAAFCGPAEAGRELAAAHLARAPTDRLTVPAAAVGIYQWLPRAWCDPPAVVRAGLADARRSARPFHLETSIFGSTIASISALAEANALRAGVPGASAATVRRWRRVADRRLPYYPMPAYRAEAYAADAEGRPEEALRLLREAERRAAVLDRPGDVAICRFQRGLRVGGAEGDALVAEARATIIALGATERLLEEDAALR